jgi:hypothetical protein
MESEDSIGMVDDNMGSSTVAAARTLRKALSTIPEAGTSSKAPTPKRPRSPTPVEVEKERASRGSRASEASGFESTVEIQPERANWIVEGKLAKLGGDFKGNTFKAVVDLVYHEGLRLKRDISIRGVAEEMLTMQCLVSIHFKTVPIFSDF